MTVRSINQTFIFFLVELPTQSLHLIKQISEVERSYMGYKENRITFLFVRHWACFLFMWYFTTIEMKEARCASIEKKRGVKNRSDMGHVSVGE